MCVFLFLFLMIIFIKNQLKKSHIFCNKKYNFKMIICTEKISRFWNIAKYCKVFNLLIQRLWETQGNCNKYMSLYRFFSPSMISRFYIHSLPSLVYGLPRGKLVASVWVCLEYAIYIMIVFDKELIIEISKIEEHIKLF